MSTEVHRPQRRKLSLTAKVAIGMAAGVAAAAALPRLELACGLGTGSLLAADVAASFQMVDGSVGTRWFGTDASVDVRGLAVGEERQHWWRERLRRCHRLLTMDGSPTGRGRG